MTKEEWLKKTGKEGSYGTGENRGRTVFRGIRDRSKLKCFNCGIYGHFAHECRKPRRGKSKEQDTEANLAQVDDEEPALLIVECRDERKHMVLLNEETMASPVKHGDVKKGDTCTWYLDNGASNHMTGQRYMFKSLDETVKGQVRFGDGSTVCIEGKGKVSLRCKNGEEHILEGVYFIPTLCNNIISLGQLSEAGNRVILEGEYLWVYEKNGKLLIKVIRSANRLYKLVVTENKRECLLVKENEATWLWHSRLGHVNFQAMKMMEKHDMVWGLPSLNVPKEACRGCLLSKQTRKSFPSKSNFAAKEKLELVHGDLCGPITPVTSAGNRYFMLLVDDFSRMMWVFMIKTKDEALCFQKIQSLGREGVGEGDKNI